MKILITGGAGFIGSHLAKYLLEKEHEVYALDDLSTSSFDNIEHLKTHPLFHFIFGSILNESLTTELIQSCDQIYHLAAAVGVQLIMNQPLKTLETNVAGTDIVLKTACVNRKKVLITSSSEVYGKKIQSIFSEDHDCTIGPPKKLRWAYAISKLYDEFLALAYHFEKNLPVVIVRLFNTIGPRQVGTYGMVVPRLIDQALKNEPLLVYGDGKQTRCFLAVQDAVQTMVSLMESHNAIGEIFNIGGNEEISIENLAKLIIRLTKSQSIINHLPYSKIYGEDFEDIQKRVPDISKIKKWIGFQPAINLEEILISMIGKSEREREVFKVGC